MITTIMPAVAAGGDLELIAARPDDPFRCCIRSAQSGKLCSRYATYHVHVAGIRTIVCGRHITDAARMPGFTAATDIMIQVTGTCINWAGSARAWWNHLTDTHVTAHQKGCDGLSGACDAVIKIAVPVARDPLQYDVHISRPGYSDVWLGPTWEQQAATWAAHLRLGLDSTQHPEGTSVGVAPHNPDVPHISPDEIPRDADSLYAAIRQAPAGNGTGAGYPDLWTLLETILGADKAGPLWSAACAIGDQLAELSEAKDRLPGLAADALRVIGRLRAGIGDVDTLTDGDIPRDADAELDTAARALRHVQRIIAEYLQ